MVQDKLITLYIFAKSCPYESRVLSKITNPKCMIKIVLDIEKGLLQDIIRRQMTFLGHVIRKYELEKVVLTGYAEGTRDRRKQRETFLTYLSENNGLKTIEMIRQAIVRYSWIQMCRS